MKSLEFSPRSNQTSEMFAVLEELTSYITSIRKKNCIQSLHFCLSRRSKTAKIKCYKL